MTAIPRAIWLIVKHLVLTIVTLAAIALSVGPTSAYAASGQLCSCVVYARTIVADLPLVRTPADLSPNTTASPGVAVLLDYNVPHIAVVTRVEHEGFWITEANFHKCARGERFILWTDPALRGFWKLSTPSH